MPRVTLYTRKGCHLCDQAADVLNRARQSVSFELEVLDIDEDDELHARYDWLVPVIAIDGVAEFGHDIEQHAFLKRLKQRS
jgi:glutaredoxin